MSEQIKTAMLLAGGRGVRLGSICDEVPKPMIEVAGLPFIHHIVNYLSKQGITDFIFLTGYLGETVEEYFSNLDSSGLSFSFVKEEVPLGTGGAVVNAIAATGFKGRFVLLNSDSFVPFSLQKLSAAARGRDGAITAVPADDAARYGALEVSDGLLLGFNEKSESGAAGLINAGIYALSSDLFEGFSSGEPYSIENDFFPGWINEEKQFGIAKEKPEFLDIGTPESLAKAESFIHDLSSKKLL